MKPTKPRGLVVGNKGISTWDARGRFYNRSGWDCGGGHVGLRSSLSLVPNYVVLALGNEGRGTSSYESLSYTCPKDWLKEAKSFDFEYSSIFN